MRKILVALFLCLLFIPLLQKIVAIKNCDYVLSGYNENAPEPQLSVQNFLSGNYQEQEDVYLQQHIPFKGFLIALKNQVDYSLFNILHYTIEQGEDRQLFLWNHIDAHCGHLTITDDSLQRKINECLYLKATLDSLHIPLVFVLAPGKPAYLEDKLPAKYKGKCSCDNDYKHVLNALNNAHLPVIDYNAWFKANRNSFSYPMFPRLGIHWSYYAACLVMDTLDRYIAKSTQIDIARPALTSTRVTNQPYKTDKDLYSLLNLLLPMQSDSLAYPEYKFDSVTQSRKPKVLIIGDSYNWVLIDTKIPLHAYSADSRFWFYKRQLYDLNSTLLSDNPSVDEIYKTIRGADMVIFLSTEVLNHRLDFGFGNWLKENNIMEMDTANKRTDLANRK